MSHQKIGPVDAGIRQIMDGNQIQDGCHSGHVGWAVALVIERNLPPVTPNVPPKNQTCRPRRWSKNPWNGGDLGWAAELIIERNFPVVISNKPQKNWMNRPRRLSFNRRKPNQRWWPCSGHLGGAAELIIERNLVTPNKPQKNRIDRPRRLSYNWRKPNVYRHRRIGHDIMPPT
jgi:hypothetical protein